MGFPRPGPKSRFGTPRAVSPPRDFSLAVVGVLPPFPGQTAKGLTGDCQGPQSIAQPQHRLFWIIIDLASWQNFARKALSAASWTLLAAKPPGSVAQERKTRNAKSRRPAPTGSRSLATHCARPVPWNPARLLPFIESTSWPSELVRGSGPQSLEGAYGRPSPSSRSARAVAFADRVCVRRFSIEASLHAICIQVPDRPDASKDPGRARPVLYVPRSKESSGVGCRPRYLGGLWSNRPPRPRPLWGRRTQGKRGEQFVRALPSNCPRIAEARPHIFFTWRPRARAVHHGSMCNHFHMTQWDAIHT